MSYKHFNTYERGSIEILKELGHSNRSIGAKPGLPLSGYEEHPPAFKLFTVDVGLLCAMTHLTANVLLEENRIFEEFKGSSTEQYVQQELRQYPDLVTTYYHNRNTEIDFVIQDNDLVIPIEV